MASMTQSAETVGQSTGESPPWGAPLISLFVPQTVMTGPMRMMQPAVSQQHSHALLQELTQDLDSDKTQPSTSNVKVSQTLGKDGLNLRPWLYDLINCAISMECIAAFQKPLPGTKANFAALHLLSSSTPSEFSWYLASSGSAYAALDWIIIKLEGGHDGAANSEWFRRWSEE